LHELIHLLKYGQMRPARPHGFSQSGLMVHRAVQHGAGGGGLQLQDQILERHCETQWQTGRTRDQCGEDIRGAFLVAARERSAGPSGRAA
jgi:hypothetical protein